MTTDMMPSIHATYYGGHPPWVGWWPTTSNYFTKLGICLRWWDGVLWSIEAQPDMDADEALQVFNAQDPKTEK